MPSVGGSSLAPTQFSLTHSSSSEQAPPFATWPWIGLVQPAATAICSESVLENSAQLRPSKSARQADAASPSNLIRPAEIDAFRSFTPMFANAPSVDLHCASVVTLKKPNRAMISVESQHSKLFSQTRSIDRWTYVDTVTSPPPPPHPMPALSAAISAANPFISMTLSCC